MWNPNQRLMTWTQHDVAMAIVKADLTRERWRAEALQREVDVFKQYMFRVERQFDSDELRFTFCLTRELLLDGVASEKAIINYVTKGLRDMKDKVEAAK